ncbi:MFS amine transporter [Apiospora rasikravindrae]|uniref:MFS amine transporter n=1 Tax=Apiospora rasikravindrae TaxID=990691 RepID=A0ABR1S4M3_9PEZI
MIKSSRGLIAISVAFALFTDGAVYTLIVPFLPKLLVEQFALSKAEGVAAYLTDRYTHKSRLFMLGNAILLASTLLFFLGPTPSYILVARALQGASGALLYISGLAFLIAHIDPEGLGIYMSYMTLATTMGELVGPLLGGSLYEHIGHWAVFGLTEGIIVVDMTLRLVVREPNTSRVQGSDTSKYGAITNEEPRWPQDKTNSSIPAQSETGTAVAPESIGSGKITPEGSAFVEFGEDGTRCEATLKDIRWNTVISFGFTTVTSVVRCALEAREPWTYSLASSKQTIPLYVLRHFSWNSTLGGAAIFALLSPAVLGLWAGRYAAQHSPRRLSVYAFVAAGCLLGALGLLTKPGFWVKVLFVLDIWSVGVCIAVSTTAHMTALSTFSQKGDELLARLASADSAHKDDDGGGGGQRTIDWGLTWLTSGVLLAGNSTAWALGMFLGPLAADMMAVGSDAEWLRLCWFLAGLCWLAALGIGLAWQMNTELFPQNTPEYVR